MIPRDHLTPGRRGSCLTEEAAIRINEAGQRADGILAIEADGAVRFTEASMAVMKSMLGYECLRMTVEESADRATELAAKLSALRARYA